MKRFIFLSLLIMSINGETMAFVKTLVSGKATSQESIEYKVGSLVIKNAFSNEISHEMTSTVGYFTITNNGKSDEVLVGMNSSIAESIQIYQSDKLVSELVIKPGETIELKPEGIHMKLTDLEKKLINEDFLMTLKFKSASSIDVKFQIKAVYFWF